MGNEIIHLDSVRKQFGDIEAIHSISLTVNEGDTFGLIGTSGSGKTTTLRMINRLIEPSSGHITINGEDILRQDPVRLRRRIGYMIQSVGLFPHYTVGENVAVVPQLLKWDPDRVKKAVYENLMLVGLEPGRFINRYPHELSGGQQQRTGLARALAADPPIILLDEPFAASDPISRRDLINEFKKLRSRVRKTIVMVTHDIPEAFELCNCMALLDNGYLQQSGTQEDLLFRPANNFVQNFFDSQRLSLELSIITLGDILPFLITTQSNNTQNLHEFQVTRPVGDILNNLSVLGDHQGSLAIRVSSGEVRIAETRNLFEAVLTYRMHRKGETNA